jgi:cyclase
MLKRRIIPIELLSNGRLVKTCGFTQPRDVGDPIQSSKVYSDQDADELILLNIDRDRGPIDSLAGTLSKIAEHCFVPLTAGGGVASVHDASKLFGAGADKIIINSLAYHNIDVLTEIAVRYGSQAVVAGIDVNSVNGTFKLYSDCGRVKEQLSLEDHIEKVIAAGAGELMIQSINRDGMMNGFDIELLRKVVLVSTIPVIVASGAGNFMHIKEAFNFGADAVACGSLFNFGDNNPLRAKAFLKNYDIPLKKI